MSLQSPQKQTTTPSPEYTLPLSIGATGVHDYKPEKPSGLVQSTSRLARTNKKGDSTFLFLTLCCVSQVWTHASVPHVKYPMLLLYFFTIHTQRLIHEHVLSVRQHVLHVVLPKFRSMQVCHM